VIATAKRLAPRSLPQRGLAEPAVVAARESLDTSLPRTASTIDASGLGEGAVGILPVAIPALAALDPSKVETGAWLR